MDHEVVSGYTISGWVSQILLAKWAKWVFPCNRGFLIWDQAPQHTGNHIVNSLKAHNISVEQVPAGCTGLIQTLDVGIIKPFKDKVRKDFINYYDDLLEPYLQDWENGIKKMPVVKTPGIVQIRKWVMESWDEKVTLDLVNSTWNTCYFHDDISKLRLAKLKETSKFWNIAYPKANLWYKILKALQEKTKVDSINIDTEFPQDTDDEKQAGNDIDIGSVILPIGSSDTVQMFKELYEEAMEEEQSMDSCASCLNKMLLESIQWHRCLVCKERVHGMCRDEKTHLKCLRCD